MAPPRKLRPDDRTLKMLANLRGYGFTMRETAKLLGVGYTTLKDNLKAEPQLREAWDGGKHLFTVRLKKRAFELAMEGDRDVLFALAERLQREDKAGRR